MREDTVSLYSSEMNVRSCRLLVTIITGYNNNNNNKKPETGEVKRILKGG